MFLKCVIKWLLATSNSIMKDLKRGKRNVHSPPAGLPEVQVGGPVGPEEELVPTCLLVIVEDVLWVLRLSATVFNHVPL